MILRCQQIPFGHAYYLSGNHYRSVRKLIGKFFIDRRRVISVNIIIGVYLLIITDKLQTLFGTCKLYNQCTCTRYTMYIIISSLYTSGAQRVNGS